LRSPIIVFGEVANRDRFAFVSDAMAFGAFHDGGPSSLAARRKMRSRSFVS
jgi:hypothetical protein